MTARHSAQGAELVAQRVNDHVELRHGDDTLPVTKLAWEHFIAGLKSGEQPSTGDVRWAVAHGDATVWTTEGTETAFVVPEDAWNGFVDKAQEGVYDLGRLPRPEPAASTSIV
uniref:hypothetical protein n=1 Tax=Nonomuraea sp. CA-252377 TaxID=3240003 RepID=UPI003F490E04